MTSRTAGQHGGGGTAAPVESSLHGFAKPHVQFARPRVMSPLGTVCVSTHMTGKF